MSMPSFVGSNETLPVTRRHDIYPTVDPASDFANQTYKGKVVLVTGASRGIGREISLFYARAGASLAILARTQSALEETKAIILKEVPSAQVITFAVDVTDTKQAENAVKSTIERFGTLDVLIANAGATTPMAQRVAEKDPDAWWRTVEVNIKGVFNFVRAALPRLEQTKGRIIIVSSAVAQVRLPNTSDYGVSKHALGRLVEYIALEYPEVNVFAMHPGAVETQMMRESMINMDPAMIAAIAVDKPSLAAATSLYLTSGKADWLNGRFVESTWDLGEVERDWKAKILEQNALVSKLAIPI